MARPSRVCLLTVAFAAALCLCFLSEHNVAVARLSHGDYDDVAFSAAGGPDGDEDEDALEAMYAREASAQRERDEVTEQLAKEGQKRHEKKRRTRIIAGTLGATAGLAALLLAAYGGRKFVESRRGIYELV